ncbi:hypothetical protein N425_14135 [Tannerella sp. oral taxon BU063 isolate Cell 2]|uniref:Uncharacterized protein n=1 Tax=Tannerella sp. oral taxon BU063 isolate Cell 2 TaxID=1411148 RepID=W2C259_9BACT|nr:hypothetical protein N425_14135 [Tannerella sp. oral taxon BU063 isolate Cell 2]
MCFFLKEEREENEGESRSPLGAEQGDFEGMLRIEVGQETATSVGGGEGRIAIHLMCTRILIMPLHRPHKRRM